MRRHLRHVLPSGLRAIRRHGYCHPAAKAKRERVALHTGVTLVLGAEKETPEKPPRTCPCCGSNMRVVLTLQRASQRGRDPPVQLPLQAA